MQKFTVLKFLVRYGPYNPDDIAGFPADVAADLVRLGTCAPHEEQPEQDIKASKKGLPPRRSVNKLTKKGG